MNYRDVLERLAWTGLSAALGAIAVALVSLDAAWVPVAVIVVNALTLLVRQLVPGVPAPGAGLPLLPTGTATRPKV